MHGHTYIKSQEHSLTSDMKVLHHPVPLQNIYGFVLRFAGGSTVTFRARMRRSWYLKRERMGVSWFESPRANLETMSCLCAQMTGSHTLWYAVRYKSLLNMYVFSALRGNNIDQYLVHFNKSVFLRMFWIILTVYYSSETNLGIWYIRYICWLLLGCHPVAVVQYTFTYQKAVCGSYSTDALRHIVLYPNEFLHSSPEALHTPSGMRDLC